MLCDSNIIIYAAEPGETRCLRYAERADAVIASVSRIEVMGFQGFAMLDADRRLRLEEIIASMMEMDLTDAVVLRAISLRQERKMGLADAIMAATALVHDQPLVTRNVDDFKHVSGLQLINPFDDVGE